MLHTPLNIVTCCQQRRIGTLHINADDLEDIKEIAKSFTCDYQFSVENSHYILQLTFECVLTLRCQSCWEIYEKSLTTNSRLVLTDDSSEQTHNELSALGYEVVIVDESQYIRLIELIKEEIFLQIPHIPRCDLHHHSTQGVQWVISDQGMLNKEESLASESNNQVAESRKNLPFQELLKSIR